MACQKISRKAAAAGFEWASLDAVWEQVRSEVAEYNDEEPGSPAAAVEFGDVLFALVNVARWQGVDAESALRASNAKFRRRWSYVERRAWERGADVSDLSTDELNALWREAKDVERGRRAPGCVTRGARAACASARNARGVRRRVRRTARQGGSASAGGQVRCSPSQRRDSSERNHRRLRSRDP
jgi:hypothetical protein